MDFIKVQKGEDGEASYVWIRYSAVENPSASDMVTAPSDYIGIYTGPSSTAPQDPNEYEWYKIKGESIEGPPGEDGKPTYIHIKYSNDGGDTFTDGNGTTPGEYMGVLVDFNEEASDTPSDYIWQFVKGDPGTGYTVYLSNENHSFSADGDGIVQASSIEFKVCAWKDTELIASTVTLPENIPDGMTVGIRENTNTTLSPIITVAVDETFKETEGTLEFTVACGDIEVTKIFSYNVIRGGKDGDGVEWSTVDYQVGENGTTPPTGEWLEDIPEVPEGKYLWTRTIMHYKNGSDLASYSVSYQGVNGTDGEDGTDGRGIESVTNYYLAYSSPAGVTTETEGWTTDMQTVSEQNRYLWNYEITTYTDDSPDTVTTPAVIGMYSTNGEDGRGIASITEYYLISELSTGVTVDTEGWTEEVQETTSEKIYLWNYEKITYTDDSEPTVTQPKVIGTKGDPGVGIKSTLVEYQVGESGTEIPAGEWTTEIPETTSGQFLWVRTTTTYTDDTSIITYSVSKNGEDGSGRTYGIETSTSFILANLGHTAFNPATVTFTPYYQDGDDGVHHGFTCDIELKYSGDGETWESLSRATNVSSRTLSTAELHTLNAYTRHVKCLVYSNGAESPFIETTLLVRDSTFETEVLFVKENNQILMDGSRLVAGSIGVGALAANSVTADNIVAGSVTADKITTERIYSDNGKSWINLHEGTFNYGGKLIWDDENLTVEGYIIATGGKIAQFTIADTSLYSNSKSTFTDTSVGVYLGNDGISLGDGFSVDANGSMICNDGYIGGWLIDSTGLKYDQTVEGAWTADGNQDPNGYTKLGTRIYPGTLGMEQTGNGERVAGGTIIWSYVIPYNSDGTEYLDDDERSERTGFVLDADGSFAFGAYQQTKGWIKFHPRGYSANEEGSFIVSCEHIEFTSGKIYMAPGGYEDASVDNPAATPGKTPSVRCALLIESNGKIVYDETLTSGYIRGLKDKIDTIDVKLSSITGEGATSNNFKITANTVTLTANDALYLKPGGTAPSSERVLFIGANGKITYASNIGTDEIGKLYGIRSNIQQQIDAIANPTALYGTGLSSQNSPPEDSVFFTFKGTNYGFCPSVHELYTLGTPQRRWKELHILNGYVHGNMTVSGHFVNSVTIGAGTDNDPGNLYVNGNLYVGGNNVVDMINGISTSSQPVALYNNVEQWTDPPANSAFFVYKGNNYGFCPSEDALYTLGIPSKRWKDINVTGEIDINGIKVKEKLNDMLTRTTADSLYLTQSNAKKTYLTISDAESGYAKASHTHSNYITTTSASSKYAEKSHTHDGLCYGSTTTKRVEVFTSGGNYGFRPTSSGQYPCGTSGFPWKVVYSDLGVETSDKRLKTLINRIDERYEKTFMALRPVNYMWKNTDSVSDHDRIHCGLIAQEVFAVAQENGLTPENFAFICHDYFDEEINGLTDKWGLAYNELHGLEVHMIQKAIHRIESLEEENASLKEQIQDMQTKLNSLLGG